MNRAIPILLCCIGLAAIAYGYWGSETAAGRLRYPEVMRVVPFFILVAGVGTIALAAVWALVSRWLARRRK